MKILSNCMDSIPRCYECIISLALHANPIKQQLFLFLLSSWINSNNKINLACTGTYLLSNILVDNYSDYNYFVLSTLSVNIDQFVCRTTTLILLYWIQRKRENQRVGCYCKAFAKI